MNTIPPSSSSPWTKITTFLLALYTLILLIGTHLPVERLPDVHTSDKLLHFVAYGVLGFLAGLRLLAAHLWTLKAIIIWFCGLLVFAALDELTQPLVNRHADMHDWFADGIGLLIGFALVLPIHITLSRSRTSSSNA